MKRVALDSTMTVHVPLGGGAEGYIVIHSTYQNSSVGGVRVEPDLSLEEVAALAREMSLKYGFIGLARGGAKAGVRIPASSTSEDKRNLLFEFGRSIAPLIRKGIFFPWTDMNCDQADLDAIYKGAGFKGGPSTDSSMFTAVSVCDTLAVCFESLATPSRKVRLGIEGFGRVAQWVAKRLPPDQYAITALSTVKGAILNSGGFDGLELAEKKDTYGDDLISHLQGDVRPRDSVLSADVDILVPAARTWSISNETAPGIKARFIVPAANAPYSGEATAFLESRGCTCLPAFVVNSGGVFGSSLYDSGVPVREIENISATLFRSVLRPLVHSQSKFSVSALSLAEEVAARRLSRRLEPADQEPSRLRDAKRLMIESARSNRILWRVSLRKFVENLVELEHLVLDCGDAHRRGQRA